MKNITKELIPIIEIGFIGGLLTFIITFFITFLFQYNGLNLIEVSLMSIITGIFLFIIIFILNIKYINKFKRKEFINKKEHKSKLFLVLIIFILSLFTYTLLDFIVYIFDDSLPKDYANSLEKLIGGEKEEIQDFFNLSFGIQNLLTNSIFGLISSLISLPFIKKNGELISSKRDFL